MFTDMVGFSALAQKNEALTLELLEEHRRLLRSAFTRAGGREVRTTGDGFLAEFESALDAVTCAIEVQQALAARNLTASTERQIRIRIGIHLGDVIRREDDVLGDGVNIAARVEPLAQPGGVCISEDVYRQIRNKLDVPITRLGRGQLKHIDLPVGVYRVGLPGQAGPRALTARARFVLGTLRPGWMALGMLALVGALLAATAPRWGGRLARGASGPGETAGPRTLAVADFVNETRETDLDGLSEMLVISLEQSRRLRVMTRARMFDVLQQLGREKVDRIDEVVGREVCQKAHVDALLLGTLRRFGELYSVELKVLDPRKNEYLFTAREQGRGKESLPGLIDQLSEATRAALNENPVEIHQGGPGVAERTTLNFEAYEHYFKGEQLLARVSSHMDVNGMSAAMDEYRQAIARDPTFVLAYHRLAFAQLWNHDDPTDAIGTAMRYLDRAPPKEQLYIQACDARVRGRLDEAAALYRKLIAAWPTEKEAHYFLGDLEFHRWNLAPAIDHLRHAIESDPHFAIAYDHLIEALIRTRDGEQARRYAWRFAQHVPNDMSARWLFSTLLLTGSPEEAEVELRRALAQYPERVEFVLAIPRLLAWEGQWARAEAELAPLVNSSQPRVRREALFTRAWIATYRGRFREAIALYDRLATEDWKQGRQDAYALSLATEASLAAWGWRDAGRVKAIEARLRAIDNQNGWAAWEVAQAWERLGHTGASAEVAARFPSIARYIRPLLRAQELCQQGRYPEGVREFKLLAQDDRRETYSHMELAELGMTQGDADGVIAEARALLAIPLEPGWVLGRRQFHHPRSLYLLARAYDAKGEVALAASQYEQLLSLWKDADPDLVDLQDARARLTRLKKAGAPPIR